MVNLESDYLRVRTIPSLKGQVVSSLENGAVIHAKILDNGWAKIGPGEYVHTSFLEAYYTNHFGS